MSVTDNKNPIQDYAEVDLAVVNSASPYSWEFLAQNTLFADF